MAEDQEPEDQGLPLGKIALDMLRRGDGDEKFVLHPKAAEVIEAALNATLLSGEAAGDMKIRFKQVISVCYVLQEKENSPAAAHALGQVLFTNPKVLELFANDGSRDRNRGRQYRKFLDDKDMSTAPQLEAEAPKDSVKLASFVTPGQQNLAARQRKSAAARAKPEFKVGAKRRPPAAPTKAKKEAPKPEARRLPRGARKA